MNLLSNLVYISKILSFCDYVNKQRSAEAASGLAYLPNSDEIKEITQQANKLIAKSCLISVFSKDSIDIPLSRTNVKFFDISKTSLYFGFIALGQLNVNFNYSYNVLYPNFKGIRYESHISTSLYGFSFYEEHENVNVITFGGQTDSSLYSKVNQRPSQPMFFDKRIKVNKVYYDIAIEMYSKVEKEVINLKSESQNTPFLFLGYSAGSTISTFICIMLIENGILNWEDVTLVTYGGPRMGNRNFAEYVNKQKSTVTRVVFDDDLVANTLLNQQGYWHYNNELFIRKDGYYVKCSSKYLEDKNCARRNVPYFNLQSHSRYFFLPLYSKNMVKIN